MRSVQTAPSNSHVSSSCYAAAVRSRAMSFALYIVDSSREDDAFHCTHSGMAMIRTVLAMGGALVKAKGEEPAYRAATPGKVPETKLRTNDDWILVPEECEILADAVGRVLEERVKLTSAAAKSMASSSKRTEDWIPKDGSPAHARSVKLAMMIERIIRIADLHDADKMTADTWVDSSPLERLAAVEAIRRASFAIHGTPLRRMARVLEFADAPSSSLPPDRRARDRGARGAALHRRPRRVRSRNKGKRSSRSRSAR